ncbi:MAG: AzlD domain-containing protein [Pseudomonadota bacterium]
MTPDHWTLIALLSASTIALRVLGYVAGGAFMANPRLKRALDVFPGCLVTALVASALAQGGIPHYTAAGIALLTAISTRNIIATMAAGMAAFALTSYLL